MKTLEGADTNADATAEVSERNMFPEMASLGVIVVEPMSCC